MKQKKKENAQASQRQANVPTTTTTATSTPTIISLTQPSDMTQTEYQDLLQQIQSDLTLEECQDELLDAARYDDIDVVRALLLACHDNKNGNSSNNNSFVNYQDATTGNTALHMAAANGHVRIVELLLHAGAHVTVTNQAGNTPLHWAAANGKSTVVELLLTQRQQQQEQVVDVLQRNAFGRSALTEGFSSENTKVVKALLEHESATEERLLMQSAASTSTNVDVDADAADNTDTQQSVTHALVFGRTHHTEQQYPTKIQVRELAMATSQNDVILGQDDPNDDTTGLGIWAASLVCAQWMHRLVVSSSSAAEEEQQQQQQMQSTFPLFKDKQEQVTILELGSGCGVPGLVVAAAIAARSSANNNSNTNTNTTKIYLTDFNPRTVENLQHNIALNQNIDTATAKGSVQVLAKNINWQDTTTWPKEKVDVMIGSDLIYQSDMVPALVNVIQGLLACPQGIFFYVAPDTGRKGQDDFFANMQQHDFVLVSERTAPTEYLENPLQSQDEEECFLHFHELMNTSASNYKLYEFRWNSASSMKM